ncbi:rhodanese-like domain-containing protein [Halobaculum sp. D14]|uniref:rhodanese-like domain-containing protein n=1 Tax=unclassified Halobaculum TaxID=2640896 RepID=UPI003EBD46CC
MDGEIAPADVQSLLDERGNGGGAGDDRDDSNGDGDAALDVRVVDIRQPAAFRRGHIPGSENVPFPELADRVEALAGADRIVTVCPHGKSSVQAARLIQSYEGTADATVESMAGGLTEWDGELTTGAADDGRERVAGEADEGPQSPF